MDRWSTSGSNILTPEQLERVRRYLEETGTVAVTHWHYRAGRAPSRMAFDEFEEFESYLRTSTAQGDAIDVWPFPEEPSARIAEGKIPNERGEVPERGSY